MRGPSSPHLGLAFAVAALPFASECNGTSWNIITSKWPRFGKKILPVHAASPCATRKRSHFACRCFDMFWCGLLSSNVLVLSCSIYFVPTSLIIDLALVYYVVCVHLYHRSPNFKQEVLRTRISLGDLSDAHPPSSPTSSKTSDWSRWRRPVTCLKPEFHDPELRFP